MTCIKNKINHFVFVKLHLTHYYSLHFFSSIITLLVTIEYIIDYISYILSIKINNQIKRGRLCHVSDINQIININNIKYSLLKVDICTYMHIASASLKKRAQVISRQNNRRNKGSNKTSYVYVSYSIRDTSKNDF